MGMKLGNLQRASALAADIPALRQARSFLAKPDARIVVRLDGQEVELPREVHANSIAIINAAINRLEEEVRTL